MVTTSYGHCCQRAARIGPDRICRIPTSRIHFSSVFSKEGMDHIVQNRPGSDVDVLVRVLAKLIWSGSKPVCRNHRAWFLAGRNRPATVSHFWTRFHSSTDVPDNIIQNQPGSDLVLADRVRSWPNGSGPEASRCMCF